MRPISTHAACSVVCVYLLTQGMSLAASMHWTFEVLRKAYQTTGQHMLVIQ